MRVVEIHRPVEDAARRIDVHDLQVFAHRTGLELFPGNRSRYLVERRGRETGAETRVDGEYPEPPHDRRGNARSVEVWPCGCSLHSDLLISSRTPQRG